MPKGDTIPPAPDSPGFRLPDAAAIGRSMADVAERSQRIVTEWLKRQADAEHAPDPLNIASAFLEMTARLMANPAQLVQAQIGFWQDYMTLWQNTAQRMMGIEAEPVIDGPSSATAASRTTPGGRTRSSTSSSRSYLLTARWVQDVVRQVDGLDDKTAQKVDFYTRQFVDAMAPSNFVLTNPEVLRTTVETGGENLLKGLNNLLSDLERGKGKLHDQDDRHRRLQGRREHRGHARQGRLPERPDAAHPIRADAPRRC